MATKPLAEPPASFDELTIVVLVTGVNPPSLGEEESERLHRRHLAFLTDKRDRGLIVASGPVANPGDPSWRGISIYTVGPAEAVAIAGEDPAVKAGRFDLLAIKWITPSGHVKR